MRSLPDDKAVPRGKILTLYSHNVQKYCARERMTSNGTSAVSFRGETIIRKVRVHDLAQADGRQLDGLLAEALLELDEASSTVAARQHGA